MVGSGLRKCGWLLGGAFCACALLPAGPQTTPGQLTYSGQIVVEGRATSYLIRHLPVSSFPQLPVTIVTLLTQRGCTIPQTYAAHRPENVIHASFEHAGSSDWAVLCSVDGTVSLLVFFDGAASQNQQPPPIVVASAPETGRLQPHDPSGVLGFNWGIDPASPQQVHDAQIGLQHRPPRVDHDALADSIVEGRTTYRFFSKTVWTVLEMPE